MRQRNIINYKVLSNDGAESAIIQRPTSIAPPSESTDVDMLPPYLLNLEDEGLVLPTISDLDRIIDQSLINESDFDIDEGISDLDSQPLFSEINPSSSVSALQT